MRQFTSQEFRRDTDRVLEAALKEPVAITYEGQPRLILLDAMEYARLWRRTYGLTAVEGTTSP
jgi:PHD/YefM family antitoxin component YafN of YafNO toxin-antitoxin module